MSILGLENRNPSFRALEDGYASTSDRVVTTERECMRLYLVCKSARMELVNNSWGFVGEFEIQWPIGDKNLYVTIILKYVLKK